LSIGYVAADFQTTPTDKISKKLITPIAISMRNVAASIVLLSVAVYLLLAK